MLAQSKGAYFYFDLFIPTLSLLYWIKIEACLLNTEPDQTSRSVHYMCKMSPTGICTFAPDKWCSLQPSLAHHSIKATVPCTPFKQSSHPNAKKTKVSQDLTKLHLGPFGCIIKALPTLKCRSAGLKIVEFELCFDSHPVFAPNLPSPTSLDCAGSWRGNYPHQHSLAVPCCPLQRVKDIIPVENTVGMRCSNPVPQGHPG